MHFRCFCWKYNFLQLRRRRLRTNGSRKRQNTCGRKLQAIRHFPNLSFQPSHTTFVCLRPFPVFMAARSVSLFCWESLVASVTRHTHVDNTGKRYCHKLENKKENSQSGKLPSESSFPFFLFSFDAQSFFLHYVLQLNCFAFWYFEYFAKKFPKMYSIWKELKSNLIYFILIINLN